ncbi:MAG: oxidoreductase [Flavobacteriales bacterium]|nr:oxidoreductase [Flavobacteriales bacterium]
MSFNLDNIPSQKGKIAIVTGANSGLGKEITIGLAKKEIKVIMACRNKSKAESAKAEVLSQVNNADIEIMLLNLNSLKSVRNFSTIFLEKYDRLDLLIENAGIMVPPLSKTEDGFESQMGVNYFSHFLLTNLLYPLLNSTKGARIATTSSLAHERGRINFDNLNAEKSYSKMGAYSQSKLACLMFAYELKKRLEKAGSNVIAVSSHPGVSKTNLFTNIPKVAQFLMSPLLPIFTHLPKYAALPTLYAALGPDVKSGDYFGPTGFNGLKGKPGKVKSKPHSYDEKIASELWDASEKLTGEKFVL